MVKTKTKTKTKKASAKVTMEQRSGERRETNERRKKASPVKVEQRLGERREKVNRRRQIDPTTCEREYTDPELEFMHALDEYKRKNGRMFPTCSEILEVIGSLGYAKPGSAAPAPAPAPAVSSEDNIDAPLLTPSEN